MSSDFIKPMHEYYVIPFHKSPCIRYRVRQYHICPSHSFSALGVYTLTLFPNQSPTVNKYQDSNNYDFKLELEQ